MSTFSHSPPKDLPIFPLQTLASIFHIYQSTITNSSKQHINSPIFSIPTIKHTVSNATNSTQLHKINDASKTNPTNVTKYTQYINNTPNNNYHPTKSPLTPFQIKYQIEPYQSKNSSNRFNLYQFQLGFPII